MHEQMSSLTITNVFKALSRCEVWCAVCAHCYATNDMVLPTSLQRVVAAVKVASQVMQELSNAGEANKATLSSLCSEFMQNVQVCTLPWSALMQLHACIMPPPHK